MTSQTVSEQETLLQDHHDEAGHSAPPPAYTSLPEAVAADMQSLGIGNPQETISVPMIHSSEQTRKRDLLLPFGKKGIVTQTVVVRKMTRQHYLKRYARDAEGNYIGTDSPAVDSALVFVPSKSTNEDLLAQVHKVAFGREHDNKYFANGWATTQAGGGAF